MSSGIPYAPKQSTLRIVKVNDAALPTVKNAGLNFADFDQIVLGVVLKNSASAAQVQPHFWSTEAAAFLPLETPETVVASGSGVRKVLNVHRCDAVFFEVTGIAGGVATSDRVFLEFSGFPKFDEVG